MVRDTTPDTGEPASLERGEAAFLELESCVANASRVRGWAYSARRLFCP
jgi:hypothetical protein